MESQMSEATFVPDARQKRRVPRYVLVVTALLFTAAIADGTALAVQDRKDQAMSAEMARAESDLRDLGAQIAYIKDGDLASMNDFIAAYAQVEPLEKEYDQKLQEFTELYRTAKERDSHRSFFDLERLRGKHHPETWEKMSRIIELVRHQRGYEARNLLSARNVLASGTGARPLLARTVPAHPAPATLAVGPIASRFFQSSPNQVDPLDLTSSAL
jgi:hypothetical protein